MIAGIGETFQQESKHTRERVSGAAPGNPARPEQYREYPDRPVIPLPPPAEMAQMSVDRALRERKSVRTYAPRPLSKEMLAYLLWASTGIQPREGVRWFRTAPSAGALYPVETYVVANDITGLPRGLYHYNIRAHALEQLQTGDLSHPLSRAAMGQRMCAQAPVVLIWTAVFARTTWRYGDRGYRYVYLDAGHIAQNLALAAVSLGLGSCQVGALFDDEVNAITGVDGFRESTIYMSVVGWPA